jgi:hypothetical protein
MRPTGPIEPVTGRNAETTRHTYPASAMTGDYLRAAAGLVPIGLLFATVPVGTVVAALLGGFAALFGVFGARTALRHGSSLEMTDTELREHGISQRTIVWSQLDRMKLSFFSTQRDRTKGWMQLELGGSGVKVSLDSRIEGFELIVRRAAEAAVARNLELNDATVANLRAFDVDVPAYEAEAER